MRNRVSLAFDRGRFITGRSGTSTTPSVTAFSVVGKTETSITMTWTVDQYVTGQLRYGTSSLTQTTTKETSFTYQTHSQTITGLAAGTDHFIQAFGENASGDPYESNVVLITTLGQTTGINYTDHTLPTSYGGYTIDHTGGADSTPGVMAWIKAYAGGTDEQNHVRLIFPGTSRIKVNTAICLGLGMDHTTLWGHASTTEGAQTSAWIRGDDSSYDDVGCILDVAWGYLSPYHSAFGVGGRYNGYESVSWYNGGEDFVIRGFDIRGNNPNPGLYPGGGFENQNALEYSMAKNARFEYNKVQGLGGDLVRFRAGATGHVHHNYVLNTGRMGCTAVHNYRNEIDTPANHVFENNTIDRCGYWGIDVEPEDDPSSAYRKFEGLVVRNNLWGTFSTVVSGGTQVGGGFLVIGGTTTPDPTRRIRGIEVSNNTIDGYRFGDWSGNKRDMWMLANHSVSTDPGVATGEDPRLQNIIIRDNAVTHGATFSQGGSWPRPFTVRYSDFVTVTNNDANFSGDWVLPTDVSGLIESGNT